MFSHHTTHKIARARREHQADESELMHLEQLAIQGHGVSDYVDGLVEMLGDSRGYDGTDERVIRRSISRAGFATSYRY